jgi:plastocyanin
MNAICNHARPLSAICLWAGIGLLGFVASGCAPGYSGDDSIQGLGGGGSAEPKVAVKLDAVAEAAGDAGAAAATVAGYGTVTGHVTLDGPPPTLSPLLPGGELRDPNACVRANIPDYRIVTGPNNALANVFVFLPRKPAGTKEEAAKPPEETIAFDQKYCTFKPHALVVRAGQTVRVLNSDPVTHNTNTKPKSNSSFNNTVKPGEDKGLPLVYARGEREPVRVVCDFHAWMLAWHLPLDHPYGAVTGEDGTFTIPDVPAGKHKFAVWHEGKKIGDYSVEVKPDETATLDITIPAASLAAIANPDATKGIVLSFGGL